MQGTSDGFHLIAPLGTRDQPDRWEGRISKKPWDFRVSCAIPHLDTLEPLKVVVDLLRCQTERPYLLVIDTGSPKNVRDQLEAMRAEDLEVHFVAGHGYDNPSEPVVVALDLAQALCRTEYIYLTHTDVFPRRRDLLAWLMEQCSAVAPVVGYRMSPRDWITDEWEWMVGHSLTMLHMPTILTAGISWSFQRAYHAWGYTFARGMAWP